MKHLLMLAYFSPPLGGGGVLRVVDTARYLEEHNWRTTLLAGPDQGYWLRDDSLAHRLPKSARVIRTRALNGPALIKSAMSLLGREGDFSAPGRSERAVSFFRRLADWLAVPDVYCGWIPFARQKGLELARSADCILSSSPPESAHLVARYLARKAGKPWVADFRDPWFRGIYRRYPTPLHAWRIRKMERKILSSASAVLANTLRAREDFLSRYPSIPERKFHAVFNGFDPEEFAALPKEDQPDPRVLKIIHLGGLTLDRDPGPVFQALAGLKASPAARKFRLEILGLYDTRHREAARALGLDESEVSFDGPVPRDEALARLARADLGLVIESFRPGADLVVPAKTYDYLGAGVPVLALVPRGAVVDLVNETGCGFALPEPDSSLVENLLRELADRARRGEKLCAPPDERIINRYRRSRQVARLAEILDSVCW